MVIQAYVCKLTHKEWSLMAQEKLQSYSTIQLLSKNARNHIPSLKMNMYVL